MSLVHGFASSQSAQVFPSVPQAFEVSPATQPAAEQQFGPLQHIPSQHLPGAKSPHCVSFGKGSFTHPSRKSQESWVQS
jgi:hypothetical protein